MGEWYYLCLLFKGNRFINTCSRGRYMWFLKKGLYEIEFYAINAFLLKVLLNLLSTVAYMENNKQKKTIS